MKLKKIEQAVEFAIKNKYSFFVQRYFVPEEYMCEEEPKRYNPEVVLNCDFDFFMDEESAEAYRKFNMWSSIGGNHQWTINVQAYLEYYEQQFPIRPEIEQLITLQKELASQSKDTSKFLNGEKKLIKKMDLFDDIDEDDLPF